MNAAKLLLQENIHQSGFQHVYLLIANNHNQFPYNFALQINLDLPASSLNCPRTVIHMSKKETGKISHHVTSPNWTFLALGCSMCVLTPSYASGFQLLGAIGSRAKLLILPTGNYLDWIRMKSYMFIVTNGLYQGNLCRFSAKNIFFIVKCHQLMVRVRGFA